MDLDKFRLTNLIFSGDNNIAFWMFFIPLNLREEKCLWLHERVLARGNLLNDAILVGNGFQFFFILSEILKIKPSWYYLKLFYFQVFGSNTAAVNKL